MAVNALNR